VHDHPTTSDETQVQEHDWPTGSFLARLATSVRSALLDQGTKRVYRAGAHLIHEGDLSTYVVVLTKGMAKVTAATPEGHVTLLSIRVAGDIVGELAPIGDAPRNATVTAATDVHAVVITGDTFVGFLGRHPIVSLEMMRVISEKLRSATRVRVATGGYPVAARLAQVIRELGDSYGSTTQGVLTIGIPLAQAELAALVGSSDAAVHKALQQLRRDGVIETGYRQLRVLDRARLADIADQVISTAGVTDRRATTPGSPPRRGSQARRRDKASDTGE